MSSANTDQVHLETHLEQILSRTGPFATPAFEPGPEVLDLLHETKILVVGAGGLGCEILKDLALSGFRDIHVIDLDTIDISNLNRQFLFRHKDVGRMKAEVAAEFIMKRCPHVNVTPHTKRLESFDKSFYRSFNMVIAGLDNVQARRWLNSMLVSLVEFGEDGDLDPNTVIPFIDGGTEGFRGQARLFFPHCTSCYECSVNTLPAQKAFAGCTLANVPRLPEHCIAYVRQKTWNMLVSLSSASEYKLYQPKDSSDAFEPHGVKFDADNPDHMSWIYLRATERAEQFKIKGVTYNLTMQVVKNIIPAIASTNALISAECVNEAFKFRSLSSFPLTNFMLHVGDTGIYTRTFEYARNPHCIVCGPPILYELDCKNTVENLLHKLKHDETLKLKNPSITVGGKPIYMATKSLAHLYEDNLNKTLDLFLSSDDELNITDSEVLGQRPIKLRIKFVSGLFHIPMEEDSTL